MSGNCLRFATSDSVICAELDDEAMLLDVKSGLYFGLEGVGARVWEALGDGATAEGITDQLVAEYDVSRAQVHADVDNFLKVLVSRGLAREVRE